ncbi:unnamed protein product [Rotaria sp. Silwood2]|nr:unnamed protein product [Rotaria sp. Silwood2]CAF4273717.1 unnamed protein product [Rotaria sp. Silwood2]CAF4357367.1 unnamed protein product [Rotaria sp. Silwood2]
MPPKTYCLSKRQKADTASRYCFVSFPSEGTHGIWPDHLIRGKGRFGFEAKFGKQWFECRIEKEGSMEECEKAQEQLEKSISTSHKQWSSAETELSDNDESSISSSDNEQEDNYILEKTKKSHIINSKTKTKSKPVVLSTDEEEAEILTSIRKSIMNSNKRPRNSNVEEKSKKMKLDDRTSIEQSSPSNTNLSPDVENKVEEIVENNLEEMKKMVTKMYHWQRRTSASNKIENNINLLTLPGKTASRFLLSAARVVLTDEQYTNGYLPDFRGNKSGRVPIPQESVNKLRGFIKYLFFYLCLDDNWCFVADAVKKRFGYNEEDMNSIWTTIRTSLVQKVNDIRKSNKRKSATNYSVASSEQPDDLPHAAANDHNDMSFKSSHQYIIERSERRKKKTNQQSIRRFRCKRKRSLVSLLSASSISSNFLDQGSIADENCNTQQPNSSENDTFTCTSSSIITDPFNNDNLNLSNDSDNNVLINTSLTSSSSSSSLSSYLEYYSSDDELNTTCSNAQMSDHRPLYASTSTTVYQFSLDILEFCRTSRLPEKQRCYLLELFRKHLPSPNLVPKSGNDLLNSIGLGKLYNTDKICGVCYSSSTSGICSTTNCIHEEMKIPPDDVVQLISLDVTEQLKLLINKNIDLLRQYQKQARTKTTSDANDIL